MMPSQGERAPICLSLFDSAEVLITSFCSRDDVKKRTCNGQKAKILPEMFTIAELLRTLV